MAMSHGKHIKDIYMAIFVGPHQKVGKNGGSFHEVTMNGKTVVSKYGRYCTIRDDEYAPPTSEPDRHWLQIYRTPDNTE